MLYTAQKIKFSIMDFFSKCAPIRITLWKGRFNLFHAALTAFKAGNIRKIYLILSLLNICRISVTKNENVIVNAALNSFFIIRSMKFKTNCSVIRKKRNTIMKRRLYTSQPKHETVLLKGIANILNSNCFSWSSN